MKITASKSGKKVLHLSKNEWEKIGKKAGWEVAKKTASGKLSHEEVVEHWQNSEEDIKIQDDGNAYYTGKLIVKALEGENPDFVGIAKWMETKKYWPNVWMINDHGNVNLLSLGDGGRDVTIIGGIV